MVAVADIDQKALRIHLINSVLIHRPFDVAVADIAHVTRSLFDAVTDIIFGGKYHAGLQLQIYISETVHITRIKIIMFTCDMKQICKYTYSAL